MRGVPYADIEELKLRGPMTAGVKELEDEAEWLSSVSPSEELVETVREDKTDADMEVGPPVMPSPE